MNKSKRIICGVLMVAIAVVIILSLTHVLQFNLLFDGWWTLFIFIPCLFGLVCDRDKIGPLFGLGVGTVLLLCAQNVINWADLWKYMIALFALIWGLTMIFGKRGHGFGKCDNMEVVKEVERINRDGLNIAEVSASFSGRKINFCGQRFEGANLKCSFGAMGIDLRGADLMDGAVLQIECAFAGVEILVDNNVLVRNGMNCAFGGVEEKHMIPSAPAKTLYLKGSCSFAGIEVK